MIILYFIQWLLAKLRKFCFCAYAWRYRHSWPFFSTAIENSRPEIIILRNDHIGDFVESLPFFRELHNWCKARDWKLVAIVAPEVKILAENCQWIDEAIVINQKEFRKFWGWKYQLGIINSLAKRHFELAINLLSYDRTSMDDILFATFSAEIKTAIELPPEARRKIPNKRWLLSGIYSRIFQFPGNTTVPEGEAQYFGWLTGQNTPNWEHQGLGIQNLPESRIKFPGQSFIIMPGNSNPRQRWPWQNFLAVADDILGQHPDWHCYLLGTASETELCQQIKNSSRFSTQIHNLTGQGDLLQLAADVKNCRFLLCNDSGAGHIAACQQAKVFCILGGPHYGLFHPSPYYATVSCINFTMPCYACMGRCRHSSLNCSSPYPCITNITTEMVMEKYFSQND